MNKQRLARIEKRVRYMRLDWQSLDQLTNDEIAAPHSNVEWVDELSAAREKFLELIETLEEALK